VKMQQVKSELQLRIRPATQPGDMGWILMKQGEIFASEFKMDMAKVEGFAAQTLADFIPNRNSEGYGAWMAEVGGTRVGCVLCVKENETAGRLRLLLVTPEGRGFGVGTSLVEHVIQFVKSQEYLKLILFTTSVQRDGHRVYERLGFVRTGITEGIEEFGPRLDYYHYELVL